MAQNAAITNSDLTNLLLCMTTSLSLQVVYRNQPPNSPLTGHDTVFSPLNACVNC